MEKIIYNIAKAICDPALECSGCMPVGCKCTPLKQAEGIYTAHVKPLEDELAAAKERKRVLVEALGEIADAHSNHYENSGCNVWSDHDAKAYYKARSALASVKETTND